MIRPDLARVLASIPGLYVVLSPALEIVAVTDAYLRATMTSRDRLIGRDLLDAFPENPAEPATRSLDIRSSLSRVVATRTAETMPVHQYDIRRPDGTFEERHWRLSSAPVLGDGGEVAAIVHQVEDVTSQVLRDRAQERRSRDSEQRLHAATARAEKTEALLADANARLRLTLDAGEVGTWLWDVVNDRVVADANLARMFGISPEDASGSPLATYTRVVHPDDRPRVEREIAHSLERREPYETEYRIVQQDGSVRWVLARGRIERDSDGDVLGLPGVVLDITARIQAEQERQALAERVEQQARIFDTTLSSITDFAYIFDKEGRFAYANQALLSLWGLTLDQAVGRNFFDLKYPDELAARLQEQIQQVFATGEQVRDETPYTSPTGAGGYYEYIFAPVRSASGEIEVVAGSTRDITARKTAEREREDLLADQQILQTMNAELLQAERAARAEAERASQVKDEFLATLSHELRTPLNAILGWTQILIRREADPKALTEGLAVIQRNAQVQKTLIEDLLDMSRIVSGKVRLDVKRLHLNDVIAAAVTTLQPTADAKGVRVRTALDRTMPPSWGDENRLQQVIWNLLSNAIKFTPRDGEVEIGLERLEGQVEITVTDTGSGMKPDFLPYVFERFRQSDASTTRDHGGLGLGLAIVKKLVELHGGRVDASSDGLGKGSRFVVALPQALAQPLESEPDDSSPDRQKAVADQSRCDPGLLTGVKVLVVDDEPDGRTLVGRILEECSAEVALAASAREAIGMIDDFAPDVLLSDIGMPDVDGYDLMRQVRALGGRLASVPAAALTALARPEDRTRAIISGYQTHVTKPVDAVELIAVVAALAGRGRAS